MTRASLTLSTLLAITALLLCSMLRRFIAGGVSTGSANAARRPATHPRPTNSTLLFTAIVAALLCVAALLTGTATAQVVTRVNGVNVPITGNSVEKKGGKLAAFSSNWNVANGRKDLFIAQFEPAPTLSPTPAGEVVWVDDAVPTGSATAGDNEGWNWVSSNPSPNSGLSAHQSSIYVGWHQHFFYNATSTLAVNAGDTLFTYVYLDPNNLPNEVMLQWNDGTWEHRAYWGANNIPWGTDGTDSRRYMGALPAAGQWVRLEVPASQVGLEGHTLNGMAFTLYGGRATWDRAGKSHTAASAAPPTVGVSINDSAVSMGATLNLYLDETILFDASASTGVYTHLWDFGDGPLGLKATTPKVAYGYRTAGTRTVTYRACNNADECSQLTFSITATARTFNPPGTTPYTTLEALQTAINNDTGGSDFVLQPGNYEGTLELSKRTGPMTRIRCASGYGLPQVRTTDSAGMCIIIAKENGQPALTTLPTTGNSAPINNYLIEGFAFKFKAGANARVPVVRVGFDDHETFEQLPKNITLRHCHIWIPDDAHASQGIRPNGRHVAVLDSTVKNIHYSPNGAQDAQAIWGWHGMYGLWVDNCFLNADTEVAGVGSEGSTLTQRPEAITYRRTHFYKPETWTNSVSWWNKNIFELKSGRSVNVDACIMETTDGDNNQGYPITLTAYRHTNPNIDTIQDVSFTRLKIKNTPGFVSMCSDCNNLQGNNGGEVQRVRFEDIVLDNQENATRTGHGIFLLLQTSGTRALPIDRLSFNRITAPLNYDRSLLAFIMFDMHPDMRMTNFSFTNVVGNSVGSQIHTGVGSGSVALETHTSGGYTWAGNVIAGITLNPPYTGINTYPAHRDLIGFVNLNGGVGGNYRLIPGHEHGDNGTYGSRPGADIDAIEAVTQGVLGGDGFLTPPASPSNLTSTGVTNASITLNWTDNSSNETGFAIVERYASGELKNRTGKPIIVGPDRGTHTLQRPSLAGCGTQIFYKVYAFNYAGNSAYSNEVVVDVPCTGKWTNKTNINETETTIGHSGGATNGHAVSEQSLRYGDGSFEFAVTQTGNYWGAGLNSGAKATSYAELEYAFAMRGTTSAEILEANIYRGEVVVQVGDVLKIAVESNKVKYYRIRGGTSLLVHTNETPTLAYPLKANPVFLSTDSSIKDSLLTGMWSNNFTWANLSGCIIADTTVGHDGGGMNGHAESLESLSSGDGSFEFTVVQTGDYWGAGLNSDAKATNYAGLEYAFAMRGTTSAEVLESGTYRSEVVVQVGDILKVAIESGQVKYYRIRGGVATHVYTNTSPTLTYPLKANPVFLSTTSAIKDGFVTGFGN